MTRAAPRAPSPPPPGCAAGCCGGASPPTARARWRRPGRAPRPCCTARPMGWDNTMKVAEEGIAEAVAGYVEMARGFEPPDARYLCNHRGHFVFVKPQERRLVSAELI